MNKLLSILFFVLLISSCMNSAQIEEAKLMSDDLLNSIATGEIDGLFPTDRFPENQTETLMNSLRFECDFINRKGHFVNDFYSSEFESKRASFLYEYYLKCDSVRIIITYDLGDQIKLYEFRIEGVEKENFMILKPENSFMN